MMYDICIKKIGSEVIAKTDAGEEIDRGEASHVFDSAISELQNFQTLAIGPGTFSLAANKDIIAGPRSYNCALDFGTKSVRVVGAGMGRTILKWFPKQHVPDHPAVMFFSGRGDHTYGNGHDSFELSNITLDGNKAEQTPSWYDGAGLFYTCAGRKNGVWRDIELKNSPCYGMYHGNNCGNPDGNQRDSFISNIYGHDNAAPAICLDQNANLFCNNLNLQNNGVELLSENLGYSLNIIGPPEYKNRQDNIRLNGIICKNGGIRLNYANHVHFFDVFTQSDHMYPVQVAESDNITFSGLESVCAHFGKYAFPIHIACGRMIRRCNDIQISI